MKFFLSLLTTAVMLSLSGSPSFGQAIYSYIDENGIQNFTNTPPVGPVTGLKVQGAPERPQAAPAKSVAKGQSFDPIIEKYASEHQLNPSLIRSIIATESGFNPKAVSPKGARGLMQLMPATAARLGVKNSFDPEENIQGGVKHFKFLMDNFNNNVELSLAAYNAGENLVQRLGRIPAIRETQQYVKSITGRLKNLDLVPQSGPEEPRNPPIIRFLDESGILHFTNIPSPQ